MLSFLRWCLDCCAQRGGPTHELRCPLSYVTVTLVMTGCGDMVEQESDTMAMMHVPPWRKRSSDGAAPRRQRRPPALDTPGLKLTETTRALGGQPDPEGDRADLRERSRDASRANRAGSSTDGPANSSHNQQELETRRQHHCLDPLNLHDLIKDL